MVRNSDENLTAWFPREKQGCTVASGPTVCLNHPLAGNARWGKVNWLSVQVLPDLSMSLCVWSLLAEAQCCLPCGQVSPRGSPVTYVFTDCQSLLAEESGQQNKAGRGKGKEGSCLLVTLCAKLHPDPLWQPCLSANTGFGGSRRKDLPCKVETVRLTDIYWPKWRTSFLLTIS